MTPPAFAGVDHVALTVTDLDASEAFYTSVLGLVVVMDVGTGRICMSPRDGFVLALLRHEHGRGGRFSELVTGVDHLGLAAASREDLERWERHLAAAGVTYTPIRDEPFGSHLNFRDPDGIALELSCATELLLTARAAVCAGASPDDIAAFVIEHVGADHARLV